MTDKEKWIEFLRQYLKTEIYDYKNSILLQPKNGYTEWNVIGDKWCGLEIHFDEDGKFKYIEVTGD